jgi:lipopolysaccharide/colanic/teichoic acid biosynthesis glycosyltransferase
MVKAVFDRIGAALLVLVSAPALLAVAVVIKLDSPGPILVGQPRVGRDGTVFLLLGFRTTQAGSGDVDDRVTRVGRVLRRLSVDQAPQLLNVLRGEMSLVGPRPPVAGEAGTDRSAHRRRLLVKPGLTGLAQLSRRPGPSWDEPVRGDVQYVEHWSLLLDLAILWRTAAAGIRNRGAA